MTDTKDWRALAEKELRGRPVEDLTKTTLEGIEVKPLYTLDDIETCRISVAARASGRSHAV